MLISIVIPTYRRPDLLRRAVDSVLAQSFSDWELIISDDDAANGEAAKALEDVLATDRRVRLVANPGQKGQSGNFNHGVSLTSGQWIKPLWDDDALRPGALAAFAQAAKRAEGVSLMACHAAEYDQGRLTREPNLDQLPWAIRHASEDVAAAMYLQQELGGGRTPTSVMVRGRLVREGLGFETPKGIDGAVDCWWFFRLALAGDRLCINQVLAEVHQGGHETVTSGLSDRALDAELEALRGLMRPLLPEKRTKGGAWPSAVEVSQMLRLVRAAARLRHGRAWDAFKLISGCWRPGAWGLALRWAMSRLSSECAVPGVAVEGPRTTASTTRVGEPLQVAYAAAKP